MVYSELELAWALSSMDMFIQMQNGIAFGILLQIKMEHSFFYLQQPRAGGN